MPENLSETRRRYFTQRELHGEELPADRLLVLELLEVDTAASEARFEFTLAVTEGELWAATVLGFESRPAVRAEVREAVVARWISGNILTVPLSAHPQLTQVEVRSPDLRQASVYRITTIGADPRNFRYRTELDPGERIDAARCAIIYVDGRPVFDTEAPLPEAHMVESGGGRPVIDSDAPAPDYRPALAGDRIIAYSAET